MNVKVTMPQAGTLEARRQGRGGHRVDDARTARRPAGSAGAANGLETCSVGAKWASRVGLERRHAANARRRARKAELHAAAASCPNAAKIGTVDIKTPLLEKDVTGSVYLGSQDTNPFASPLVLYIVAEEENSKVLVKLAGEVKINPHRPAGLDFKNTPQTPFETLTLHLFNSQRASQATPALLRRLPLHATFTNWSSNAAERSGSRAF